MYGLNMTWLGDAKRNNVCWASETWREKRRPDWRPVTYCLRGRKKRTPVLRGQCAEQLRSTQRSGVQSHTYNQGVAKPLKAIGCSSLRRGGGELVTFKSLTYGPTSLHKT